MIYEISIMWMMKRAREIMIFNSDFLEMTSHDMKIIKLMAKIYSNHIKFYGYGIIDSGQPANCFFYQMQAFALTHIPTTKKDKS